MKTISHLYRITLSSVFAFILASFVSFWSMESILKFKDLSLQIWKVTTDWNELSLITSDIMFLPIDSIEALPELHSRWDQKTEVLHDSLKVLTEHPKIGALSPELADELDHAVYIWEFSRKRVKNAQNILKGSIQEKQILSTILRGGKPTLYENIKALSTDPDLSFEEKRVYLYFSANMAVFDMTRSDFTDILRNINAEIPQILDRRILVQILLLVSLYLSIILFALISLGRISRPMKDLVKVMEGIGEMDYRMLSSPEENEADSQNEIEIIQRGVSEMSRRIAGLYEQNLSIEKDKQQAKLKALQYQINPHFLYNTLGTIQMAALLENQPRLAQVIKSLTELLRKTINLTGEFVFLSEELSMIHDYINIMQFRYSDRLILNSDIPRESLSLLIPSRIIQPILENAIVHGLSEVLNDPGGRGVIGIEGALEEEHLILRIRDEGAGIDPQTLRTILTQQTEEEGGHVGMQNIDQRIKLHFGEPFGLEVDSGQGTGTVVTIRLPRLRSLKDV